jgi:hypothetical protein
MEITNIRHHRIHWRTVAVQGALAGVTSALFMLVLASVTWPAFADDADGWTFLKVVGSATLGGDAASPLTGFDASAVIVGLVMHLSIGIVAGAAYGLIVAFLDLEGWTPVALVGMLYGAVLFVWSTAIVGAIVGSEVLTDAPLLVMFWSNVAFGLVAGLLLATWADGADLDQLESERVPVFEGDDQPERGAPFTSTPRR